jgi:hypothetical protein
MKTKITYILGILALLFLSSTIKAQDFPSDYFSPKQMTNQPKSNSSFFYGSYGYYLNMDFEDVADIQLDRGKYSTKYTVAWFKNTDITTKKGFEFMATADMWSPVTNLYLENGTDFEALFQSFNLKFSNVGKKGSAVAFYAKRDVVLLQDLELGMWGWGVELIFGGHPALTHKRDKWPFSLTIGTSQAFQQRPANYDESRWADLKEKNGITTSFNTAYATMALQRIAHKKGLSIYVKMEATGAWHQYGLVAKKVFLMEENQEFVVRAGAAFGILF